MSASVRVPMPKEKSVFFQRACAILRSKMKIAELEYVVIQLKYVIVNYARVIYQSATNRYLSFGGCELLNCSAGKKSKFNGVARKKSNT